jgi:hypothetical protein
MEAHLRHCKQKQCGACGKNNLSPKEYSLKHDTNCRWKKCGSCNTYKLTPAEFNLKHGPKCNMKYCNNCDKRDLTQDVYDSSHGKKCKQKKCSDCGKNNLSPAEHDSSHGLMCMEIRCAGCLCHMSLADLAAHRLECKHFVCTTCDRKHLIADAPTHEPLCRANLDRARDELRMQGECDYMAMLHQTPCSNPPVEGSSRCSKHLHNQWRWRAGPKTPEDKQKLREFLDANLGTLLHRVFKAGGHPYISKLLYNLLYHPDQVAIADI